MPKVITPEARLSYPHIFTPDEKGKFSAALIFAPGTDLTAMKKAAIEVAVEKFGKDKALKMIQAGQIRIEGGPHHTFRTDKEEEYGEGAVFVNARGTRQPGVVSIYPDPVSGKPMPITNPEEIYPGAVVKASLTPYWYDVDGNKGIAWGLNNLQKIRDGDRLDGRIAAEDEFAADESAVADLSDLTDEPEEAPAPKATRGKNKTDALADLLK
jgi:hypothetical protein